MRKKENYSKVKEYALIVVGTFIYALGIHWFLTPNEIAPGGMTGISVVINSLTKLPVGNILHSLLEFAQFMFTESMMLSNHLFVCLKFYT